MHIKMSSAISFSFEKSKILSSGNWSSYALDHYSKGLALFEHVDLAL